MSFQVSTPIRLEECVFSTGLPLTEEDYWDAVTNGEFAKRTHSWRKYHQQFASAYWMAIAPLEKVGLRVISYVKPAELEMLFVPPSRVVILLTHWNGTALELGGAMHQAERLIRSVPEEFNGVIDLAACNGTDLCKQLARKCKQGRCMSRHVELCAAMWMLFYGYVLAELTKGPDSYLNCLEKGLKAFRPRADAAIHHEER